MLEIDVSQVSGGVVSGNVTLVLEPNNKSLISTSGSEPYLFVNEKVAGLPSYTGKYFAKETGRYCLSVFSLKQVVWKVDITIISGCWMSL